VDISVKIKDNFSGTLEKLEQQIENLDEVVEIITKLDDSDLDEALAKKEALEGDTRSTHIVDVIEQGDNFDPPGNSDTWSERFKFHNSGVNPEQQRNLARQIVTGGATTPSDNHPGSGAGANIPDGIDRWMNDMDTLEGLNSRARKGREVPLNGRDWSAYLSDAAKGGKASGRRHAAFEGFQGKAKMWVPGDPEPVSGPSIQDRLPDLPNIRNKIPDRDQMDSGLGKLISFTDKFDGKLKKLMPTMHKWMQLVAAVLPMMISLGTAAMGVAASFGAVAAAGGAIVGLGLMGMDDKKERLEQFREELRNTFEGTAKQFAPLADSILTEIPGMLSGVSQALGGASVFKQTFVKSLQTVADSMETLIRRAVSLSPIIEQLTNRFLGLVTSRIVDFLTWLTKEAYRNQDAMVSLSEIFGNILITIYNLSKAVSAVVIGFKPFFSILKMISSVLKNEFAVRMAQGIALVYTMTKAMKALRAATMTTGIGALLVGGGLIANELMFSGQDGKGVSGFNGSTPSGIGSSGGSGDTYVMEVDGDVTDRHIRKFETISTGNTNQEFSKRDKRER